MKLADMILSGRNRRAYNGRINTDRSYHPLEAEHMSPEALRSSLRRCPVVVADNVADYFTSNIERFPVDIQQFASSIPSLAPPFDELWIESRFKWLALGGTYAGASPVPGGGFGALFRGLDCRRGDLTVSELGERWILEGSLYLKLEEVIGPMCSTAVYVAEDGTPLAVKVATHPTRCSEQQAKSMMSMMCPLWLSVGFMHCKNVTLRDESVPEKLRKAKQKRGRLGLVKWHTLEIEPMKQVLRSEGKSESTGLKQALHICRGHFKDYRQSGLFGKVKGVFWWDSTVRGSSHQGVVVKDYAVDAPKQT